MSLFEKNALSEITRREDAWAEASGIKQSPRLLTDADMEVIYTGRHQTAEQVAHTALEEDVDAIGLSFLSGAHLGLTKRLMERIQKLGIGDKKVIVGGVIPKEDIARLKEMGVQDVFPVEGQIDQIVVAISRYNASEE